MVKALDLSSNGRVVRVGSNPTPGRNPPFNSSVVTSCFFRVTNDILHFTQFSGFVIFNG